MHVGFTWELLRHVEAQAPSRIYWIRMWILTKVCVHINIWEVLFFLSNCHSHPPLKYWFRWVQWVQPWETNHDHTRPIITLPRNSIRSTRSLFHFLNYILKLKWHHSGHCWEVSRNVFFFLPPTTFPHILLLLFKCWKRIEPMSSGCHVAPRRQEREKVNTMKRCPWEYHWQVEPALLPPTSSGLLKKCVVKK